MKTHRTNVVLIPLAASALLFLSACGNKGPLVMPQKPVPVEEVAEPMIEPAADGTLGTPTDATPPANQDVDAGNPASVPDPVPLQDDKPARDNE